MTRAMCFAGALLLSTALANAAPALAESTSISAATIEAVAGHDGSGDSIGHFFKTGYGGGQKSGGYGGQQKSDDEDDYQPPKKKTYEDDEDDKPKKKTYEEDEDDYKPKKKTDDDDDGKNQPSKSKAVQAACIAKCLPRCKRERKLQNCSDVCKRQCVP